MSFWRASASRPVITTGLTGRYDSLTGGTLVDSAMAHVAMLFAPAHQDQWPGLSPTNMTTAVASRGVMDGIVMTALSANQRDH